MPHCQFPTCELSSNDHSSTLYSPVIAIETALHHFSLDVVSTVRHFSIDTEFVKIFCIDDNIIEEGTYTPNSVCKVTRRPVSLQSVNQYFYLSMRVRCFTGYRVSDLTHLNS